MTTAPPLDLAAVKARQQAIWASGDFAQIATLILPAGEHLSDAADLRAGSTMRRAPIAVPAAYPFRRR